MQHVKKQWHRAGRRSLVVAVALLILAMATIASAGTSYLGWVTTSTSDAWVNRAAVNPVNDIKYLVQNPSYVMAYRSGASSCSAWAPTTWDDTLWHHQGIQRITRNGANYLVVTDSIESGQPGIEVVELGTKGGTTGTLGSNVAAPMSLPDCADAVVRYSSDPNGPWVYNHASGFSISGSYAIVPLENSGDGYYAGFVIVNLSDPVNPSWGPNVFRQRGQVTNAGAGALTRLAGGQFIALVFGNDSDDVEVFVSTEAAMPYFGSASSTWQSRCSASTPFGRSNYQNLNLVTDTGGQLYVVGTHRDGSGEDWADIWRLDLSLSYVPSFTKLGNRHMYCNTSATGNETFCNFDAGAGIYVDGSGHLVLYGVEHYNDHPYPWAVGLREFD